MTNRVTVKDAERALDAYCAVAHKPRGHYIAVGNVALTRPADDIGTVAQLGGVFIARRLAPGSATFVIEGGHAIAREYGGYQVQAIDGGDNGWQGRPGEPCTGVSLPFGYGFHTARELVAMLTAARYAVSEQGS